MGWQSPEGIESNLGRVKQLAAGRIVFDGE